MSTTATTHERRTLRDQMRAKLAGFHFTHFVTLSSNHQDVGQPLMRDRLRAWDARVNRWLNGPQWARRPDERMLWFAFMEKALANPHWHLLVQLDPVLDTGRRAERALEFPERAAFAWSQVFPRGSFDCQPIENEGALRYATKVLDEPVNYENFVLAREFVSF